MLPVFTDERMAAPAVRGTGASGSSRGGARRGGAGINGRATSLGYPRDPRRTLCRVHTAAYVDDLLATAGTPRQLDADTRTSEQHRTRCAARGGCSPRRHVGGDRWSILACHRTGAAAWTPRASRCGHGVLPVQQRDGGRGGGSRGTRCRARAGRGLGRASRQRHRGDVRWARGMAVLQHTSGRWWLLPGHGPAFPGKRAQRAPMPAGAGDEELLEAFRTVLRPAAERAFAQSW